MKKIFKLMMATAIAACTFTACEDVPEPYNNPYNGYQAATQEPEVVVEPAGDGTQDSPYNVARALEVCAEVGEAGTSQPVYARGVITSISEVSAQYGNATFIISDNGRNALTVYRAKGLNNENVTDESFIQKGDTVTIYGNLVNYKGNTPEFTQGCYVYSITKGEGGDDQPETATPGTAEEPLTVAQALEYINALGADTQSPTGYVKGFITSISEIDTGNYGNATYIISDSKDGSNALTVYRGYSLGGEKFKSADEIKVGDEVIVTGKLVNFRGNTPEFTQGNSIYALNGKTAGGNDGGTTATEATGNGTLESPYNALAAIQLAQKTGENESDEVYIKGKVASISEQYGTQFGNATFTISDDGSEGTVFTIYRANYLGNQKYTSGDLLNKGDDVIIYGRVTNFRGTTPETIVNKAYLYSLNGKTADGTVTPEPQPSGEAKGSGTLADPFNVQAIINFVSALDADVDTKADYYVKGIVTEVPSGNNGLSTQFNNASFYISDDAAGSNRFYVFRAKGLNGGDVTDNMLKVGDEVVIFGSTWVNYKGNTPETKQGEAYVVSVSSNGSNTGNTGGNGGNDNTGGEVSGNSITVSATDFGFADKGTATQGTLADGTKIVFDKGEGKTAPVFYDGNYAAVRLYAKNTITITASKKIAKVHITTTAPNGTQFFNGNDIAYAQGADKVGINKESDTSVSFSGLNAQTVTIVNDYSTNSGGTQLRLASMTITYAE